MKKMILIGGGATVLLGGAVGATLFLTGALGGGEPDVVALGADGTPVVAAAVPVETYYYALHPEFVVNLKAPSREKFLMVELSVATHDEGQIEALDDHKPELRNDLLSVFGDRDSASLATEEGRLELREAARGAIDALLAKHYGPAPVDDVFLTRFVMQ